MTQDDRQLAEDDEEKTLGPIARAVADEIVTKGGLAALVVVAGPTALAWALRSPKWLGLSDGSTVALMTKAEALQARALVVGLIQVCSDVAVTLANMLADLDVRLGALKTRPPGKQN